MVTVEVDPDLSVAIERGESSAYRIEIVHDGTPLAAYGSAAEPWSEAGQLMLGNVVASRLDGYERDEARALLAAAFREHASSLDAAFD